MIKNNCFTEGPIKKRFVLFALPIALSNIVQQLFHAADSAIVGRFTGSVAMAAVGNIAPVFNMFISLYIGLSIGANVVISHLITKKDKKNISEAINTILSIAIVCGILMLFVTIFGAEKILLIIDSPENVLRFASIYLKIFGLAMPAFMIYNFGSAILRGMGDSKTPTYIIIFTGLINVALDLFFVCICKMGVAGVAIATDIANYISCIIVLVYLKRYDKDFSFKLFKSINYDYLKKTLQYGIPAGLQGLIFALSNMLIQSALNTFGDKTIAGSSIAYNFECIGYFIISSFNHATTTFIGQNSSLDLYKRCKKIHSFGLICGIGGCLLSNVLFWIFRYNVLSVFTLDKEVINLAIIRFSTVLIFQWIAGAYEISSATMRGMGHSYTPAILTFIGTCVLRVVWVLVVFPNRSYYIWLLRVYPISWALTSFMIVIAYFVISKKEYKRMKLKQSI